MGVKALKPDEGREINRVFLHCSASLFGDAEAINKWHRERAEAGEPWGADSKGQYIGYHYVILNGCRAKGRFNKKDDGVIERGREDWEVGIHAKGHNQDSLAICLIGDEGKGFTVKQIRKAVFLAKELMVKYQFGPDMVFAHNQVSAKTCPGFDIEDFRALLRG